MYKRTQGELIEPCPECGCKNVGIVDASTTASFAQAMMCWNKKCGLRLPIAEWQERGQAKHKGTQTCKR